MCDGRASTHQRSPSSGEIAHATADVRTPATSATTIDTPESSRAVARRRASSTALATQTEPNGTWHSPMLSDASAYTPRPDGPMKRPVRMIMSICESSTPPRPRSASNPPDATDGGVKRSASSPGRSDPPACIVGSGFATPGEPILGCRCSLRDTSRHISERPVGSREA